MKHRRGASKLEFVVTVVIFGVLAALMLARLSIIQEEAERTEVDLTIRNIRVGIQLAIGERIMRGEEARIFEVAAASPVDLLGHRPRGFTDQPATQSSGQWAYDPARRELSYMPRLPKAFAGVTELRWRYVDRLDSSGKTVGVSLVSLN